MVFMNLCEHSPWGYYSMKWFPELDLMFYGHRKISCRLRKNPLWEYFPMGILTKKNPLWENFPYGNFWCRLDRYKLYKMECRNKGTRHWNRQLYHLQISNELLTCLLRNWGCATSNDGKATRLWTKRTQPTSEQDQWKYYQVTDKRSRIWSNAGTTERYLSTAISSLTLLRCHRLCVWDSVIYFTSNSNGISEIYY
jgi:hypothetical protein